MVIHSKSITILFAFVVTITGLFIGLILERLIPINKNNMSLHHRTCLLFAKLFFVVIVTFLFDAVLSTYIKLQYESWIISIFVSVLILSQVTLTNALVQ